jgi:hypothetical protein
MKFEAKELSSKTRTFVGDHLATIEVFFDDENSLLANVIDDGFWQSHVYRPIFSRNHDLSENNDFSSRKGGKFENFEEKLGSNSLQKDGSDLNFNSEEISSSFSEILEFQKDTVNYMNQLSNNTIEKIDNLENFLKIGQSNIVESIQKNTEAIQLNQNILSESLSVSEEIRKRIIQNFTLFSTLLQESTNKLENQILESDQKQLEAIKDHNDKTIRSSLQNLFKEQWDKTISKEQNMQLLNDMKKELEHMMEKISESDKKDQDRRHILFNECKKVG